MGSRNGVGVVEERNIDEILRISTREGSGKKNR
jgi:hypothetical protein